MKEKRKNLDHPSRRFILQCALVGCAPIIFAILFGILFTPLFPIGSTNKYDESFALIMNGNEVTTENEYSDYVSISVKGKVEVDGEFVQDAHYVTDTSSDHIEYFEGFYIDGVGNQERLRFSAFPKYNIDGDYEFLQYIEDTPHPVTFPILSK